MLECVKFGSIWAKNSCCERERQCEEDGVSIRVLGVGFGGRRGVEGLELGKGGVKKAGIN